MNRPTIIPNWKYQKPTSGGSIGLGFAIPIDTGRRVADAIVAGEPVQLGYLGVSTGDPTDGTTGAQAVENNYLWDKAGATTLYYTSSGASYDDAQLPDVGVNSLAYASGNITNTI